MIGLGTIAAVVALRSPFGIDYDNDAQPAIDALREGRLGEAFAQQPLMGSFSVALRAPFAELSELFGDESVLLEYRLGAIPCLLAGAALAWWLWGRMVTAERPAAVRAAVAALIVINPMVFSRPGRHTELGPRGDRCRSLMSETGRHRAPALIRMPKPVRTCSPNSSIGYPSPSRGRSLDYGRPKPSNFSVWRSRRAICA